MNRFITHLHDVLPYSPPGHSRTTNYRLLSPGTSGSDRFEVVLGQIEFGGQADPHAHEKVEQAVFVLDGKAVVEIEGESEVVRPMISYTFLRESGTGLPHWRADL